MNVSEVFRRFEPKCFCFQTSFLNIFVLDILQQSQCCKERSWSERSVHSSACRLVCSSFRQLAFSLAIHLIFVTCMGQHKLDFKLWRLQVVIIWMRLVFGEDNLVLRFHSLGFLRRLNEVTS